MSPEVPTVETTSRSKDSLNGIKLKEKKPSLVSFSELVGESDSEIKSLFDQLFTILVDSSPTLGFRLTGEEENSSDQYIKNLFPKTYINEGKDIAYHEQNPNLKLLSEDYLRGCLQIPQRLITDLKKSHESFISKMPTSYSKSTYSGSGYLFIAGGKFTWLSLLSIINLKSVGSQLPIELIIPRETQYEPEICEEILPTFNGRCIKLYDLLPSKYIDRVDGYQYKVLALIASSFERVIYLDSDNIPVMNPDSILEEDPFTSKGLILWPDFWRRRHHPVFYEITNREISDEVIRNMNDDITPPQLYVNVDANPIKDVPLHDRRGAIPDLSTESGQLVIDKSKHFKTLMLSLYYNFYGPRHYYPILGQRGAGEGDKDTFYAAAHYFNEPVYQVHRGLNAVGRFIDGEFVGAAMVQYDPVQDYLNVKQFELDIKSESSYQSIVHYLDEASNNRMFMHCNFPKLEPGVLTHEKYINNRMYGEDEWQYEFELKQWKYMSQFFCLKRVKFHYLPLNEGERSELCSLIEQRIQFIKENK